MSSRRRRESIQVDITPLIDVLFMLIIFFVLSSAFVQGSIDVNLPAGQGASLAKDPIVVAVAKDGSLSWAGKSVDRETLMTLARESRSRSEDILIAGDRDAPYGRVASLLSDLKDAGVVSVGIAYAGD